MLVLMVLVVLVVVIMSMLVVFLLVFLVLLGCFYRVIHETSHFKLADTTEYLELHGLYII